MFAGISISLKRPAALITERRQVYLNVMTAVKANTVSNFAVKRCAAYVTFKGIN
jgi:hypothetical protein